MSLTSTSHWYLCWWHSVRCSQVLESVSFHPYPHRRHRSAAKQAAILYRRGGNNDYPLRGRPYGCLFIEFIPRITSTPIHARAWKGKALADYNSQQIPTNNNIHTNMLIIIISLRWKYFVIISYLYKIPTINEPYNQRKRGIRQTHTDILTA